MLDWDWSRTRWAETHADYTRLWLRSGGERCELAPIVHHSEHHGLFAVPGQALEAGPETLVTTVAVAAEEDVTVWAPEHVTVAVRAMPLDEYENTRGNVAVTPASPTVLPQSTSPSPSSPSPSSAQ